mmetsp:Transcript_9529/g.13504  ORF Transcript_9529/g.13504 Transcript_9529/m.13504 type:complete len:151 (+) Transcript_9529:662-1114(+)
MACASLMFGVTAATDLITLVSSVPPHPTQGYRVLNSVSLYILLINTLSKHKAKRSPRHGSCWTHVHLLAPSVLCTSYLTSTPFIYPSEHIPTVTILIMATWGLSPSSICLSSISPTPLQIFYPWQTSWTYTMSASITITNASLSIFPHKG